MSRSIADLYDLLSVAALGCNAEVDKRLADFHEDKGLGKPYFFAEYICSQPLFRGIKKGLNDVRIEKDGDWAKEIYVMAPFASRMIRNSLRIPQSSAKLEKNIDKNKKIPFTLNTEEELYKLKIILPYEQSSFFHPYFETIWSTTNNATPLLDKDISGILKKVNQKMAKHTLIKAANVCNFRDFGKEIEENYRHLPILELKDFGDRVLKDYRDRVTYEDKFVAVNKLLHYEILRVRWGSGENQRQNCYSAIIPIASPLFLYGFLWVWLPVFDKVGQKSERENLYLSIARYIKDAYAPTLAIVFENFSETLAEKHEYYDFDSKKPKAILLTFNRLSSKRKGLKWYIPFMLYTDGDDYKQNNIIDNIFIDLWNTRICNLKYRKEESSWPFKKYVVASAQMIQKINNSIESANSFTQSGSSLPSVLVIGSPGSGKDTLPDILRVFSNQYRKGPLFKLNIAAIKPNFLVGPVITGIEIRYGDEKNPGVIEEKYLEGILTYIRNDTIERFKIFCADKDSFGKKFDNIKDALRFICKILKHKDEKGKHKTEKETLDRFPFPTLVLDELNSLDVDSQGILLRYLENSEIVPTGGIMDRCLKTSVKKQGDGDEDEDDLSYAVKWLTNCLVIGVMNEDPDEITREKAIEFLGNKSYLGGFLSDVLYEHILKIRRLRPDLKYRMIRNGKIILPSLKERCADIPILFYIYAMQEVESLSKQQGKKTTPATYVTYHAFDRLMSPEIKWYGNIRELQALAKKAAYLACAGSKRWDAEVLVRKIHIEVALKQIQDQAE